MHVPSQCDFVVPLVKMKTLFSNLMICFDQKYVEVMFCDFQD